MKALLAFAVAASLAILGSPAGVETLTQENELPAASPMPSLSALAEANSLAWSMLEAGAPADDVVAAVESTGLEMGNADWFAPEALENCDYVYWFITDTFVNACDPWNDYFSTMGAVQELFWQFNWAGPFYDFGSCCNENSVPGEVLFLPGGQSIDLSSPDTGIQLGTSFIAGATVTGTTLTGTISGILGGEAFEYAFTGTAGTADSPTCTGAGLVSCTGYGLSGHGLPANFENEIVVADDGVNQLGTIHIENVGGPSDALWDYNIAGTPA